MKKNVVRILTAVLMLSMVFSSSVFAAEKTSAWDSFVGLITGSAKTTEDTQVGGVTYRTHIENEGWAQGWVQDGEMSGSSGKGLRLEGIEIKLQGTQFPEGLGITYRTHIQNEGWAQGWVEDGEMSGSEGKGLRLEGIEIKLTGDNAADYSVEYRTHIQNEGWAQGWVKDGEMSGSEGKGLRLEGIEIKINQVEADLTAYLAALDAVDEADYTPASWAAYQEVVEANAVTTEDTQSAVDAATEAIVAAQNELVEIGQVTSVFAINATTVEVTFEEELASVDKSEFAIEGLTVANAAVKQTNKKVVVLTTSAQVGGTEYKLVYQGVDTGLTFTGISAVIPTTIALESNSIQSKVGSEVTLKANIGQATAGVAVTFNVDAPAGSLNNDVIAEAYTNAEGIATYSYTQYAAGTDAVAVYPTGAPTTRATAKVFWGVSDILTVTESATGGAVNGTTRTYTVTLVNPANSVALQGAVVNVTLWENVNSVDNTTANDTNAVVADPSTGGTVTPFQSATNERAFTVTTDANGKATFTLTGSNTTATPVVFIDSNAAALATAGIAGNGNSRLEAAELQVKMPAVAFTGAQTGYTFDFSPMTAGEYASGLVNTREYKAVVKKADGAVYANGRVVVGLDQLIDNNLVTSTTAVFTDKNGAPIAGPNGNVQEARALNADANGVVTFYVAEPDANRSNVTTTPAIWIDLDAAGNTNLVRETGEPQALAPTTTFQAELAQGLSNLDINTVPAIKDGPFVTGDQVNATFEIRNQSNTLSQTAGFNRVTYTITNTSGATVTINPALTAGVNGPGFGQMSATFNTGSTATFLNGNPITLNAGSSVTLAGTAAGFNPAAGGNPDTSTTNAAVLSFVAGAQDNSFSISATGTTVRRFNTSDARNVGSVSQAAKTATIKNATAGVVGQTYTGEILGYGVADGTDDFGRLVVKLDGSGSVVTVLYGDQRTGNVSDNKLFIGTDGTFANLANFNALAYANVTAQKTQFDKFENAFEIGNRLSVQGRNFYLANVKNVSKTIASGNDVTATPVVHAMTSAVATNNNTLVMTFTNVPAMTGVPAQITVDHDNNPATAAEPATAIGAVIGNTLTVTFPANTFQATDIGNVVYTPGVTEVNRLFLGGVRQDSQLTVNGTVNYPATGVSGTLAATTPGVNAVGETNDITLTAANGTGTMVVTIVHPEFNGGAALNVNVPILGTDNAAAVATKAQAILASNATVNGFFIPTVLGDDLTLTVRDGSIADVTVPADFGLTASNNIVTPVTGNGNSNGGAGAVANEATLTVDTGAVNTGTITVTIAQTSATLGNSTIAVDVNVVAGDDAAAVAGKIRTALNANGTFAARYNATIVGAAVTITNNTDGAVEAMTVTLSN